MPSLLYWQIMKESLSINILLFIAMLTLVSFKKYTNRRTNPLKGGKDGRNNIENRYTG